MPILSCNACIEARRANPRNYGVSNDVCRNWSCRAMFQKRSKEVIGECIASVQSTEERPSNINNHVVLVKGCDCQSMSFTVL